MEFIYVHMERKKKPTYRFRMLVDFMKSIDSDQKPFERGQFSLLGLILHGLWAGGGMRRMIVIVVKKSVK